MLFEGKHFSSMHGLINENERDREIERKVDREKLSTMPFVFARIYDGY